jgi:16S rRNA (adenine1518-N6/adenine1519-N6)-dimethyltransferase
MSKLPFANKDLGQHFLRDMKVITSITEDFKDEAEVIIEVGPGPGILTEHLAKHELPFFAVEMDTRFDVYLTQHMPRENIHFADALGFDWDKFFDDNNLRDKKCWLVSNLPYNISSQLFILFLKHSPIKYMTLMFQKEVAEKIHPKQDQKNSMSSLKMMGDSYFDIKSLVKAPPGAFVPPPKVDSLVLSMERKETSLVAFEDINKLEKFGRKVFSNRRKQLQSVLKKEFGGKDIPQVLENCGISPQLRAEALELSQVLQLFKEIK